MSDLMIEGLTALQRDIADQLWQLDSEEEITHYINQLPKRIRKQAIYVKELLIAASLDHAVQTEEDTQLAASMLRNYMRNPSC